MASIDLKEVYLQVPVHPDSRPFLRFVSRGHIFQFKALCFGLSTGLLTGHGTYFRHSPLYGYPHTQISRRLASPVVLSGIPPPGSPDCPRALPRAGGCDQLGEIPPRTIPGGAVSRCRDQLPVFCGSPSPDRISRLQLTAGEFRSSASPPARLWLSLLGMLSSLAHLVPGGRLRMRSLQLCLNRSWGHVDLSAPVSWTECCLQDLRWWLHLPRLSQGVSLCQVSPDLGFWSDASDVG